MSRHSSIEALGDHALVHLLEFSLGPDALEGARPSDPFDSARIREAANLLKRVCKKHKIGGEYVVIPVRNGTARVRAAFLNAKDRDLIADLAGAENAPSSSPWASVRYFVLDLEKEEALTAAGNPRDNRGPGRRAREKAQNIEQQLGPRWVIR